ncbi:hypothetical protein EYF80_014751 [Liparis tanakae]|uniref:Uncharacterized protein n=1 Tax=Liparis tanakae TaxID=230148 RepID=A0A4Z2IC30_9TELE|nr:hypothetical protein EYF80_014751 [Liparis tanakae]
MTHAFLLLELGNFNSRVDELRQFALFAPRQTLCSCCFKRIAMPEFPIAHHLVVVHTYRLQDQFVDMHLESIQMKREEDRLPITGNDLMKPKDKKFQNDR